MFTPQFIAHIVSKQASYTLDDFTIVGNVAEDPGIVVVPVDSPIKNLDDLVAAAKADKLTASVNGIGSDDFLAAKNFESLTGVSFNLVPTKGSTEQKAAVMGSHVDVAFMNLSQMLSQHNAGQARIIAILSKKRSDVASDIATSVEQGYPKLLMTATRGIVIRNDVDKSIQEKIVELYSKVVKDPEFQERCAKTYIFLDPMDGATYKTYLQELQDNTQKVYDISPW
jgi:tripartite-type tricarboxylate transporter receptor subunit TctC